MLLSPTTTAQPGTLNHEAREDHKEHEERMTNVGSYPFEAFVTFVVIQS